jgi:hypothetical protein
MVQTPAELKDRGLPAKANNMLITVESRNGQGIGHCFVSQWNRKGDRVWWVTQLVVQPQYRNQRRATRVCGSSRSGYPGLTDDIADAASLSQAL